MSTQLLLSSVDAVSNLRKYVIGFCHPVDSLDDVPIAVVFQNRGRLVPKDLQASQNRFWGVIDDRCGIDRYSHKPDALSRRWPNSPQGE
jgi:hypothetical protein